KFCTKCGSFSTHYFPLFFIIKFYSKRIKLSKKLFVFLGVLYILSKGLKMIQASVVLTIVIAIATILKEAMETN
ncbi:MAG: hypothetical protein AB7E13_11295, partial [Arcobacteraceae bacterium]